MMSRLTKVMEAFANLQMSCENLFLAVENPPVVVLQRVISNQLRLIAGVEHEMTNSQLLVPFSFVGGQVISI